MRRGKRGDLKSGTSIDRSTVVIHYQSKPCITTFQIFSFYPRFSRQSKQNDTQQDQGLDLLCRRHLHSLPGSTQNLLFKLKTFYIVGHCTIVLVARMLFTYKLANLCWQNARS